MEQLKLKVKKQKSPAPHEGAGHSQGEQRLLLSLSAEPTLLEGTAPVLYLLASLMRSS
jgi:hypothetical protein